MVESARKRSLNASRWVILGALFATIVLAGCADGDAGTDSDPQIPATPRSTVAAGTATLPPDAPSPTSFLRPTSVISPTTTPIPEQVTAVIERVAQERQVRLDAIMILSYTEETWSSTALGCPVPGRSYAQIVTSGFEILMTVAGELVIFHVDQSGAAIVECERGQS